MKGRKKRTITLAILCCLLVFMGVVYSIFSTRLTIGGTTTAINTWSILIDSITPIENQTSATSISAVVDEVTKTNASFEVDFKKPGDYMEYTVVVKNNGSINGYIDKVNATMDDPSNPDNRLFKITSDVMPGTSIKAGESISFSVSIEFDENATRIPTSGIKFELSAEILQGEGNDAGGNTPEGGGETPDPEGDWLFDVDENGEVVAYNYNSTLTQTPQDVVVPSEVNGVPVTAITEQSFMPKGNLDMYMDEDEGQIYFLIFENTTEAYQTVKQKGIKLFIEGNCKTDTACIAQYEAMINFCSDNETCYNLAAEKAGNAEKKVLPDIAELMQNVYVDPDPNVALEDSVPELKPNVKTLDLSNATNLIAIEDDALKGAGLESVDFGDNSNITSIGDSAFSNNELTSVEIPSSVETIGSSAFSENKIETITIGSSTVQNQLTKDKKYSLSRLGTDVEKITTSNINLKVIGSYAFSNNRISGEFVIPASITTIGYSAFSNNNIEKLFLPKTVTSLESGAFSGNPLQTLTIEECNTTICSGFMSGNYYFGNKIKTLTIESGEIGEYAFHSTIDSTTKIESLTLGEGVTSIGIYAFRNNSISQLTLPDNISSLGLYAFENNQISEVSIPASLTEIGQNAFSNNNITELILPKTTNLGSEVFSNNPIQALTIGKCTMSSCANNSFGTQVRTLTVESGEIGSNAFSSTTDSTTKLENLTLGEEVTYIGINAFYGNGLTDLTLPQSLTAIGYAAFKNNPIENLTIGKCTADNCLGTIFENTVKNLTVNSGDIPGMAFDNASYQYNIESLTLGDDVTSIGYASFRENQITSLDLPKNLTQINVEAFYNNPIKANFIIPKTLTEIGERAFYGCQISSIAFEENSSLSMVGREAFKLTQISGELILPESLVEVGAFAFQSNQIDRLYVPKAVETIDTGAFNGNIYQKLIIEQCKIGFCGTRMSSNSTSGNEKFGYTIQELEIRGGEIGSAAFAINSSIKNYTTTKLEKLTLGEGITYIGDKAFQYNSITELTIPADIREIKEYAFTHNEISNLTFSTAGKLLTIGNNSFTGNSITSLEIPEGVTTIGDFTFSGNSLTSLSLPSTIANIGNSAFNNNQNLGSIFINKTQTAFGNVTVGSNWYDTTKNPTISYKTS